MSKISSFFGDPTPIGYAIAIGYFIAALTCHKASIIDRQPVKVWTFLTVTMAALGFNKQLDLQTVFTNIFRAVFKIEGWYEDRREVQFLFILGMIAVGLVTSTVAVRYVSDRSIEVKAAVTGMIVLLSFIVIRAASFHHVDLFLSSAAFGIAWNTVLEVLGIAIIFGSAVSVILRRPNL
ncbi:hypothetical protein BH09PSE3_BH09PSE3_00080 [soil metagenome]